MSDLSGSGGLGLLCDALSGIRIRLRADQPVEFEFLFGLSPIQPVWVGLDMLYWIGAESGVVKSNFNQTGCCLGRR